MNRRHFATLAATTAVLATSLTTVVAAGAFASSTPAPKPTPVVTHAQDQSPPAAVLAHEAVVTQRAHQAIVNQLTLAQEAKLGEAITAHNAVQGSMWSCIRDAESGDNYSLTSGAYGILISTWNAYSSIWSQWGSYAVPGNAPAAVQDLVAYRLYEIGGGYGGWHDRCTGV